MPTETTTPTITPVQPKTNPNEQPWTEIYTQPIEICPQQVRELASPDVEP